jgi:8-oxo-dGTP diphosphatase
MAIVYAMNHGLNEVVADGVSRDARAAVRSEPMTAASPEPARHAKSAPVRPLPRVGSAAIVVNEAGELLLGVRAKPPLAGHWVLPGGGVRPFETVAQAVEREVVEETGLVVEAREQLGVWEVVEPPDEHRLIVYNRADLVGGELTPGDDLSEVAFWSPDQLTQLQLTPLVELVLRELGWITDGRSRPSHRAA